MATNTIHSRIQLKNDTETHWNQAVNFVPKQGEVIIYSADTASGGSHPFCRLKIGDGVTSVINLPFIDSATVSGFTVNSNVPADAVFTDTRIEVVRI